MTDTSVPADEEPEAPAPEPEAEAPAEPEEDQPHNPPHWTREEPPADEDAGTSA